MPKYKVSIKKTLRINYSVKKLKKLKKQNNG